jgi:hypothetical protein
MTGDEDIKELIKTLLTPKKDIYGDRTKAAITLGACLLNINAFNALYSVCAYPDVFAIEDGLLKVAGESAAKILSTRDQSHDPKYFHKLDPKYFDGFHSEALDAALMILSQNQIDRVYEYAVENPQCSEALSSHFYTIAVERSFALYGKDHHGAMLNASNAIKLFSRFIREERNLLRHFKNITMHIIKGEPSVTILPFFFFLEKHPRHFNQPTTEFEAYEHLHIMLLTKLICSSYANIQNLFANLRQYTEKKYTEDKEHIKILELMLRGDFREAYKLSESIKGKQKNNPEDVKDPSFYQAWYLIVNWLIKERVF